MAASTMAAKANADMRTLFVTSEAYQLAKTGGLADVSAALPKALRALAVDCHILLPGYPGALARAAAIREIARLGDLGCGETRLLETVLPGTGVPVWLVDCPKLFNRAGGLYQDQSGAEWSDNARRFGTLNQAALMIAEGCVTGWRPDLIHCNDWHAGVLPLALKQRSSKRTAAVFTIHNLAYQGLFDAADFPHTGLRTDSFCDLEFWGRISYLKAGIVGADAITTVSPTYAQEILTPEYGCGMDGLLRENAKKLSGILNGADYGIWSPEADPHLPEAFSAQSPSGKLRCKRTLQEEFGLAADPSAPLMAFMSRLAHQKMPDVVLDALPALIAEGLQFILVAEGDRAYQNGFEVLAANYPGRVAVQFGYSEPLAHRVLAGGDLLAHPARYEPCGLLPIYGMRYGAIPLVRRVGGMADSVTDSTAENLREGTATGFAFDGFDAGAFANCARRAITLFKQPLVWRRIQAAAMARNFGWKASAQAYVALYRSVIEGPACATVSRDIAAARAQSRQTAY